MGRPKLTLWDDAALEALESPSAIPAPPAGRWIRLVRAKLRMSQTDLARRAGIDQAHLARIESGRVDPNVDTLRRVFAAMECDLVIAPRPKQTLDEILRSRARDVARRRLEHSMGTMALERQAPGAESLRLLLEKKADEILNDPRARLWKEDE